MSMKLDEKSINLKEEEIKGGLSFGLPNGVEEVKDSKKKEALKIINNNTNSNLIFSNINSLIKINKTSKFLKRESDTFTKINNLFEEKKTGKNLQFLKASFFKTDENTIYTYSEHRIPTQLFEDFSEYYKIEFERIIEVEVNSKLSDADKKKNIKAFITLINIIYLLCHKINEYFNSNNTKIINLKKNNNIEYLCVKYIIEFFEKDVILDKSLKDIIITDLYKNSLNYSINNKNLKKITKTDIFDIISLSKTNNISLKIIINKLYELNNYLLKIIPENNTATNKINILKPELYDVRTGNNINIYNYDYLYYAVYNNHDNISINITDFNKRITNITSFSDDSAIRNNLNVLNNIFNDVLQNFNKDINDIKDILDNKLNNYNSLINDIFESLCNKKDEVIEENNIKNEIDNNVDEKIKEIKEEASIEVNNADNERLTLQKNKGLEAELKQLQTEYNENIKLIIKYYTKYKEESNNLEVNEITLIHSEANKLLEKDTITDQEYNDIIIKLKDLDNKITEYKETVNKANKFKAEAIALTKTNENEANIIISKLTGDNSNLKFKQDEDIQLLTDLDDNADTFKTNNDNFIKQIKDKYELQISKQALVTVIKNLLTENKTKQDGFKQSYNDIKERVSKKYKDTENVILNIKRNISKKYFEETDNLVTNFDTYIYDYKKLVKEAKNIVDEAKKAYNDAEDNLNSLKTTLQNTHGETVENLQRTGNFPSIEDINKDLNQYDKDIEEYNTNITKFEETYREISTNLKEIITNYAKDVEAKQIAQTKLENKSAVKIQKRIREWQTRSAMRKKEVEEKAGGKSNTKELRKKLNTMSIKQLKRLSNKNNIEYGNKNTIKSLINNYMKHIMVN